MPREVLAIHTGGHSIRGSKLLLTFASHWCILQADKYCSQNLKWNLTDYMCTPFLLTCFWSYLTEAIEHREMPRTARLGLRLWHVNTAHHHEIKRENTILRGRLATFAWAQRHISTAILLLVLFLDCSIWHFAAHRSAHEYPWTPYIKLQCLISLPLVLDTEFCKSIAWCNSLVKRSKYFWYRNKMKNLYLRQANRKFYKYYWVIRHSNFFGCSSFTWFDLCLLALKHQYLKRKMSVCSENTAW